MKTYTVYDPVTDTPVARGLSAEDAAVKIMQHDGHDYTIQTGYNRFGPCAELMVTDRNPKWPPDRRPYVAAFAAQTASPKASWALFVSRVLAADDWDGFPRAMPDAEYDAMHPGHEMTDNPGRPAPGCQPAACAKAVEIVREFEEIFGELTATERLWLVERISQNQPGA